MQMRGMREQGGVVGVEARGEWAGRRAETKGIGAAGPVSLDNSLQEYWRPLALFELIVCNLLGYIWIVKDEE